MIQHNSPTVTPSLPSGGHLTPEVLDEFEIQGPNGVHPCYIYRPAQGTLISAKGYGLLFPMHVARALAARLALAVTFVHANGYIHGDIHLNNTLISFGSDLDRVYIDQHREKYGGPMYEPIVRADGKPLTSNAPAHAVQPTWFVEDANKFDMTEAHNLILSDFGEAYAPAKSQRLGKQLRTPMGMRAPESLFEPEAPLSYSVDIWSLGVAIWAIMGVQAIFSTENWDKDELIAEQFDVLGRDEVPVSWLRSWDREGEDDPQLDEWRVLPRAPKPLEGVGPCSLEELERYPLEELGRYPLPGLDIHFFDRVQKWRLEQPELGVFEEAEIQAFLALIRAMLRFAPEARMTTEQVLKSEWMVKWALPALETGHREAEDARRAHDAAARDQNKS